MLSKNKIKWLQSLHLKKNRAESGLFLAEGKKIVLETLHSDWEIVEWYATESFIQQHTLPHTAPIPQMVSDDELSAMGTLETNHDALAVVKQKKPGVFDPNKTVLVADTINDPGNWGTMIRTAVWFGVKQCVTGLNTVELYNPKVINASKGAFLKANVLYTDLKAFLKTYPHPIYVADLHGMALKDIPRSEPCAWVVGNESHGINPDIIPTHGSYFTIPGSGENESLNVSISTAIILYHHEVLK